MLIIINPRELTEEKAVTIVAISCLWYKTRRGFANDYRLILTRADTEGGVPVKSGCLLGFVEA